MTLGAYLRSSWHLRAGLLLIGDTGSGKSTLTHALLRRSCRLLGRSHYVLTKSLDSLGVLGASGWSQIGGFGWADTNLTTLRDEAFNEEEAKALLGCEEEASYRARYHSVRLPAHVPRIMSVNSHGNAGHWAAINQLPAVAAMANRDLAACLAMTAHERAACRRLFVCVLPSGSDLLKGEAKSTMRADLEAMMAAGLEREAAYQRSL
jgi:hypothetical protein